MALGVSVIIPTWNGAELLKEFLPGVLEACNRYSKVSSAAVELIVVDDGSTDTTSSWLRNSGFPDAEIMAPVDQQELNGAPDVQDEDEPAKVHLRLLRTEMNRGFAHACNLGISAAARPLIFLLNNDVRVNPECIAPLAAHFEDRDEKVFAVHCRVTELSTGEVCGEGKIGSFERGFLRVHQSYAAGSSRKKLYSMFAGGGSAMFDRKRLIELGGFESLMSPYYWEDVELSYRAWKRGFEIHYEPSSEVSHRVSSTIGKLDRRSVRIIEQRNRIIYHWIHIQDWRFLLSHIVWVILLGLTAPFRFRVDFIQSLYGACSRLGAIRRRRRQVELRATRTDRDVLRIFEELSRRSDIRIYD